MKLPIILCFLLANAVCVQSSHFPSDGLSKPEEENTALEAAAKSGQKIPGACFVCKLIMRKVKYAIPHNSKVEIKRQLHNVCNWMLFLKGPCTRLINRYFMRIVDELLTHDGARLACRKMRLCWWNASQGPE